MPADVSPPPRSILNTCLTGLSALTFTVLFLIVTCRPLGDPDFWWHLKTGEMIVKGHRLLAADPFNFTSDPLTVTLLERVILKAYWLWQVVAYGFYQLAGFSGVKLLSGLTLAGTYATLGWSMVRNQVRLPVALPLLVTSLFLYRIYGLERPQVVSFWFAAMLVAFFLEIRRGERPTPWLYPVMLLWANIHGGFTAGVALLAVFAVGSLWDLRHDRKRLHSVLWWCGGGLLASLVNPSGANTFALALGMMTMSSASASTVAEFSRPFRELADTPLVYLPLLSLLAVHCVALLGTRRRRRATDWLLSLFVVAVGAMYMRNLGFVIIALVPLTACFLSEALADRTGGGGVAEKWVAIMAVFLLTVAVSVDISKGGLWRRTAWPDVDPSTVPQNLTRFLDATPLQGNVFNYYGWGGYLLWELYPKYRLFIDGRNLHGSDFFDEYQTMLGAVPGTDAEHPEYQRLLDKYRIDYVVLPNQTYQGQVQPLLKFLLRDRNWFPIYQDESGFVLARAKAETAGVIGQYALDKVSFLYRMLADATARIRQNPEHADYYLNRGELLGYMGHYAEAEQDFAMVQQLDPGNESLEGKIMQLQKTRELANRKN